MTNSEKPAAALVKPATGSRLELLAAAYRDAKDKADAANERLTEIKDALKVELVRDQPNSENIHLWTPVLENPLRLHLVAGSWRVDAARMKKEDPALYVKWAKQGQPTWKLEAA